MRIPTLTAKRRARIEIIPLIDIIFFLLATFVMVSLSMVKNQGLPVQLPRAATGAALEGRESHTVITITENGEIFLNKEKIAAESVPSKLRALRAKNADPKVFINGDERAHFGKAIGVLDEARKAGITKVSIQTTGKDS
ncbi:MAG: biopolymer transporter ExbD [Candidatus Omnitrophica bacterium]|nr:biopolymer transporter ExbD [Candidatus Omnitrophota bacterium]